VEDQEEMTKALVLVLVVIERLKQVTTELIQQVP
jgi:hypothetical protein